MNALYDFFLTPQPKDSNKTRYHARLVVRDTITLEDIAETIESRSSLRQSDVIGAFIEFANVFKQELSNGNSIHIPGVGSFRIKAESPEVRSPKETGSEGRTSSGVFRKAVTCSKLPFIMLTCSIASDTFIKGATNPIGTTKEIKNTGSESVPSM